MEVRETTRREVGGRARTPCCAGGESAVVARVSPLHLNYCVSLYRNGVLGFWGNAVQTSSDTFLGLLLFDLLNTLKDHTLAVHLDALDKPLQNELLVLSLDK